MGLQSKIQTALHAAGMDPDRLGDAYRDMFLVRHIYPKYDPKDRDPKPAEAVYAFKAFLVEYEQKEIDGDYIKATDIKIIAFQHILTQKPNQNDRIRIGRETFCITTRADGTASIVPDPADASWVIGARKI